MRTRTLRLAWLFVLGASSIAGAQSRPAPQAAAPATGTAVISGQLVIADKGGPVRKATLRLYRLVTNVSVSATTDADGRFVFAKIPAGDYKLVATRPGFLDTVFGARQPGPSATGTPIVVADDQKIEKLVMPIFRGGVITGTVVDEFGDPAFNVPVQALLYQYFSHGERIPQRAGSGVTDDRGAFRIAGLLPGDYLISATPRDSVTTVASSANAFRQATAQRMAQAVASGDERAMALARADAARMGPPPPPPPSKGYVTVFHPSATLASNARAVRLGLSDEACCADVSLSILETASIVGVVRSSEGPLPDDTRVQLVDPTLPVSGVGVHFRNTEPDGRFSFLGIAPGQYVLRASAMLSPQVGGEFLTVSTTVTVGEGAVHETALALRRGVHVSGRVDLGTLAAEDRAKVTVNLSALPAASDWESPPNRGPIDAEGKFVIKGVPPGRYFARLQGLPSGWTIGSAKFNGTDAVDHAMTIEVDGVYADGEIAVTSASGEVNGAVTLASGDPAPQYAVILFPEDRTMWLPAARRIKTAQAGRDGRYVLRGLPAGKYLMVPVLDPQPGREFDPIWLGELVTRAQSVTIGDGETRTQNLRIR